jgi:hypothetical protein
MFIRFRQTKRRPRLQVSLVETRKEGRRVRHEHIASLGSIALPFSTTDRVAFWEKLDTRLAALANRMEQWQRAGFDYDQFVDMMVNERMQAADRAERRAIRQWHALFGL